MNLKLLRFLVALTGLGVCVYALHCAYYMSGHIGKPDYLSNAWFWKAHACIPVLFMIRAVLVVVEAKEKQNAKRNIPVQ
jgi:hypothetical protein